MNKSNLVFAAFFVTLVITAIPSWAQSYDSSGREALGAVDYVESRQERQEQEIMELQHKVETQRQDIITLTHVIQQMQERLEPIK